MDAITLAGLFSAKLCHDLVGPVGAAANGLDLIDGDDPLAEQAEALSLARSSVAEAIRRLKFFRLAFGAESTMATGEEARRLSDQLFKGGKAQLRWPAREVALSPGETKLLLNLVLIGRDAAQRGGEVRVELARGASGLELAIESHGPMVVLPAEVYTVLQSATPPPPGVPLLVVVMLARELARGLGVTLECRANAGREELRVRSRG
jgi:histidine phosphotransferase ChpT